MSILARPACRTVAPVANIETVPRARDGQRRTSDRTVSTATSKGPPRSALRASALAVWCFAIGVQAAQAQVLILAPHPDDEALFASGIIYQARLSGQTVKVVVATNGDCAVPTIGQVRQQESVAAMGVLGLTPDDVIFLGYPDCGLYQLYHDYASAQSRYTSVAGFTYTYASEGLGRTDYHSYIHGAPAAYNGFSLTDDLETLLRNYRPQDVYVTSAYDDHTDHYTLNHFVGDALLSLIRSDATFQPTLHDAIVHEPCELCDETYHWPMPTFTPTVPFPMPPQLGTTPLGWSDAESVNVPAPLPVHDPDEQPQVAGNLALRVPRWTGRVAGVVRQEQRDLLDMGPVGQSGVARNGKRIISDDHRIGNEHGRAAERRIGRRCTASAS
jgi:LmbE family N-acetylglucosaminyl deacetylase